MSSSSCNVKACVHMTPHAITPVALVNIFNGRHELYIPRLARGLQNRNTSARKTRIFVYLPGCRKRHTPSSSDFIVLESRFRRRFLYGSKLIGVFITLPRKVRKTYALLPQSDNLQRLLSRCNQSVVESVDLALHQQIFAQPQRLSLLVQRIDFLL